MRLRGQAPPGPRHRAGSLGGRDRTDRRRGWRALGSDLRDHCGPRGPGALPRQRDRRALRGPRLRPDPPGRQARLDRDPDRRPRLMLRRARFLVVAVLVVAPVGLMACGSDDDPDADREASNIDTYCDAIARYDELTKSVDVSSISGMRQGMEEAVEALRDAAEAAPQDRKS